MVWYRRLRLMERQELSRMLAAGLGLRAIGQALSRAQSTLSRELSPHRASPATYRAQRNAHQPRLRTAVFPLLAQRWSSEQIAYGLPQQYPDEPTMRISHEAIYTSLYVLPCGTLKRESARYLRHRHRFRRPMRTVRRWAPW